jgi:O-antigen/teichoic acid export membrane protein
MHILSWEYIKEKWAHAGFQKYFQNLGWMFFARLGSMVISFFATIYIARNLGPTNYGELSYAISFVSIFSFIAALGIDQVLYRELIQNPDKKNLYMGSALVLRLTAALVSVFLCTAFALFYSPKYVSLYLIFLLSLGFIFNSFQIIGYEFQSHVQSKLPSLLSLFIAMVLNVLKIIVIILDQGVVYLGLILLLESILFACGYLYFRTKMYGTLLEWKYDKSIATKILTDSWPLMFSAAFAVIYGRIDQIMIKNMLDATSVGLYDAAVRLSEVWYFIPATMAASLFPAIINARKTSVGMYHARVQKLVLLLTAISIFIAFPIWALSPYIVHLIFGSAFSGAIIVLQIYVWSNVSIALSSVINLYLIAENRRKILFFTSFFAMLTNVILNIYLIPTYGISGAAIATLISYSIPCIIVFITPTTRKLFMYDKIDSNEI